VLDVLDELGRLGDILFSWGWTAPLALLTGAALAAGALAGADFLATSVSSFIRTTGKSNRSSSSELAALFA
jgi:hypothetical protein